MSDALEERLKIALKDSVIRDEIRTLGFMIEIYCKKHHGDQERTPYTSLATTMDVFEEGHHTPLFCEECADHMRYGEKRRALCPKDPKPSCKTCDIHCYKPEEAAFQQKVMRYSGPRALLKPYLIRPAFEHMQQELQARIESREQKKDS